jgi:hypothetical protein
MKNNEKGLVIKGQKCPIHQAHPALVIDSDRFTIRCCCIFLTRQYISKLETKLKGLSFETILSNWENDLLINELQTDETINPGKAINTMLRIKKVQEQ